MFLGDWDVQKTIALLLRVGLKPWVRVRLVITLKEFWRIFVFLRVCQKRTPWVDISERLQRSSLFLAASLEHPLRGLRRKR
jgi:hypothetical protein